MPRALGLVFLVWCSTARANETETAALRRAYEQERNVGSLLDWADAERGHGHCVRADKLYRFALKMDEMTPEERYRAQIGVERCEDPFNPHLHRDQAAPVAVLKKKHRPRPEPEPEPEPETSSTPHLGWRIAGFTTAGVTVAVTAVRVFAQNPGEQDFALNSTTGLAVVGAALTGAFLWRGYSDVVIAPAVSASSVGVGARVEF